MMISVDVEKALDKNPKPFLDLKKKSQKSGNIGKIPQHHKHIYKNFTANII